MRGRAALLVVLAGLLAGCTPFPTDPEEMRFEYTAYGVLNFEGPAAAGRWCRCPRASPTSSS